MGGSPSCDSPSECVIRACQFSKHGPDEINRETEGRPENEEDAAQKNQVNVDLANFFKNNQAADAKSISLIRSSLMDTSTPSMDINAGCIGFKDAVKTTEKFNSSRSRGSLLACTIIGIAIVIMMIFAWWLLCHRTYKRSNVGFPRTTRAIRSESPPRE